MRTDESFDRLLKRTFSATQDVRPAGPCLDADTLAAWTEGALAPHERAAAEAHAAECDRCMSVLVAITQASPPSAAPPRARWFSMRWLVPLTTAATAAGIWVLVQNPLQSPEAPPTKSSTEQAKTASSAERFQANPSSTPSSPAVPIDDVRDRRLEADAKVREEKTADSRQRAEAPVPTGRRDEEQSSRAAASTLADAANVAGKPDASLEKREMPKESSPVAGAAAPPRQAPAPQAESSRTEVAADSFRSVARQIVPQPLVIVSPSPAIRWRVSGSSVERSTDGGSTWRPQFTAPGPGLLAGSSPASDVCWLVGRSGLVLLSTDGETWHRLEGPDPTLDLVRVTAGDAASATVVAANGRTFQTTDGGRSWIAQENPLTPF